MAFEELISLLKATVDRNDHGEAIRLGMRYLGMETHKIETIIRGHRRVGYLTAALGSERNAEYEKMMDMAKRKLGDDYQRFHSAF